MAKVLMSAVPILHCIELERAVKKRLLVFARR